MKWTSAEREEANLGVWKWTEMIKKKEKKRGNKNTTMEKGVLVQEKQKAKKRKAKRKSTRE